ncbi:hypothetical protein NTG1052_60043 [Candidatus Nitrotoga sp. 1052]|uniref:hypothetical protein n=1 Tax=Candidatus Nitrotoga sp. 1052 TaxID=2886964 RepID=UPI001EF5EF63|nr:hypothetical protein [Candidatus Nitrotoga sp. 1052]CAH1087267.1 hypothetical protein NTG1052_60043 [Candidatus Nitrotoga sp. 1052]
MKITRGNQSHPLPLLTTRYPYTLLTMPIVEVNHVTKEYQLGQLQSLKTTVLNQWRGSQANRLKNALHSRRWTMSTSPSSKAMLLVLLVPTAPARVTRIGVCPH